MPIVGRRRQASPTVTILHFRWIVEPSHGAYPFWDAGHRDLGHIMLCLLGRPTLTAPSGARVDLSPSAWRLLAIVATSPNGIARSGAAELLFPEPKLSTLRNLVFVTRRALDGAGLELLDGESDVLRLSEGVACDVHELRSDQPARALHEIYRGPFFDMRSIEHGAWQAWLGDQRRRLLDAYVERVEAVLASPHVASQHRAREAHHLIKHRPGHAEASRCLMLEAARLSDAAQVEERYGALQVRSSAAGAPVDRRATHTFHRLVGASQRGLGRPVRGEAMRLPTIHVLTPADPASKGAGPSHPRLSAAERMLRSLLVDVAIGLCRASMFRVISSEDADTALGPPAGAAPPRSLEPSRSYRVSATIVDHVCGPQVVFALRDHPGQEILWTERITAARDLTVQAYNLLTVGVLRSLVDRIKDVEMQAFRVEADPDAYAFYLAGYSSLGTLDLARLRQGRGHLRRALSRSPDFAPTPSALARSLQLEWLVTGRGGNDLLAAARGHALHAIAADPLEARGYKALAFSDLYEKRFDAALENYEKAEQLNRNYADLVSEHANCLLHCGLLDEALEKVELAMQLNPTFGDMYCWTKASACFLSQRYDQVLETVGLMRDREPVYRLLAATHALLGHREEAREYRMKAMEVYPATTIAGWTDTVALKDPRHIRHYAEGLSQAGFE